MDPVALARDLLRCPSVTPAEGGALGLIEGVLEVAGFEVHRVTFAEPGTEPVENLYARIGSAAPHLVFAGHTDVVPPGDPARWSHPPFAGEIVDGTLYGRGAVDMKGAVACALAAALDHLVARGGRPQGSISFLITGDEESVAVNGTVKLLQWAAERGAAFDHCILGEPSNAAAIGDTIKVGRRGSLNGTLVVTGTQGHVAYPERADNPARALQHPLQRLPQPGFAQDADREARRRGRRRARALAYRMGTVERRFVPRPARPVPRSRRRRDQGGNRSRSQALDQRRHLGRALHQGLLPGAGIRPGRTEHAPGRRAHRGRRSRHAHLVYRKILDRYFG